MSTMTGREVWWTIPVCAAIIAVVTCTPAPATTGQPIFGMYSQKYIDSRQAKRWKAMCKGPARYQAMSEAYEAGKPDPCNR